MSDQLHGGIVPGSTDISLPILLRSTSDSTEVTGKVAADVTASYWRQGGSRTNISASDLTTITDAHAAGGWKEVDATNMPGVYRFDIPDAAVATGADWVVITIKVAGAFTVNHFLPLQSLTSIADAILQRSAANVEDVAGDHTLAAVIFGILESSISGTTWTIKKSDGSTTFLTKTVTKDAAAEPITGVS